MGGRTTVISDLHLHSKYSRGCSTDLDIVNLEKYARIKGLDLLGTGDFTHPKWIQEIKTSLVEDENAPGIFRTKSGFPFLLQTEISLIYSSNGKGRRIHNVVLAPNLDVVDQITQYLLKFGRVDYDGRPIFKIPCPEFTESLMKIDKNIEIIPAHIWTPHFSLFGDYNQFNTAEECFEDQTKNIHALETGMSSDPQMNWRVSCLDRFNLVSFSDSHSFWPWRIGREATTFELKQFDYRNIIEALRVKKEEYSDAKNRIQMTIEVDPGYGKYHLDGHRSCNVCMTPSETIKAKGICPKCGRKVTIGVENRVEQLADRADGFRPKGANDFMKLIPLAEIISALLGKGIATKGVTEEYYKLIKAFGTENNILLNADFDSLSRITNEKLAKAVIDNRNGLIKIIPGYDGEYGYPVFGKNQMPAETTKKESKTVIPKKVQKGLDEF
ncbi:MAG: endonuclease Q family protein [Nanoarchaeota archaeon]|nr:endonuclease Q family protein [Nanoarchaeota archaeon]